MKDAIISSLKTGLLLTFAILVVLTFPNMKASAEDVASHYLITVKGNQCSRILEIAQQTAAVSTEVRDENTKLRQEQIIQKVKADRMEIEMAQIKAANAAVLADARRDVAEAQRRQALAERGGPAMQAVRHVGKTAQDKVFGGVYATQQVVENAWDFWTK